MSDHDSKFLNQVLLGQFEAALCMLHDCISLCPPEHWDGPIAKYPFWQVAHHALSFVDFYLSPSEADFRPRVESVHPKGMDELNEEYPSRRFSQEELLTYALICREKLRAVLGAETLEILEGPSGFPRLNFSRAELHVYNTRHVQHHAGQLAAFLRRAGVAAESELGWVRSGWR